MYKLLRKQIGLFNLKRKFTTIQKRIEYLDQKLTSDSLLAFVFSDQHKNYIAPFQKVSEITNFIRRVEKISPKCILEIGTANGGSLFLMSRVADDQANIISIDLPAGNYGGGYPAWKIGLYKSFAKKKQQIHLLRENSHDPATLDKVKFLLNGKKLDLLFIDADHTYEGVKQDFLLYKELLKEDGYIGFHDTVHNALPDYGVARFWKEIKDDYDYVEFIDKPGQNGYGIGLLRLNGKI